MTAKPRKLDSLITAFDDSTYLCFTRGAFDDWRVTFLNSEGKQVYSPKDTAFFDYFLSLIKYGNTGQEIFNIIKRMSKRISKNMEIDFDHLRKDIHKCAEELHIPEEEELKFEKAMMSVLAAMLSEEKKAFTKLGKKLKLLGLHQVLIGKMEPKIAANWSRGKSWQEILKEYRKLNV